VKYTRRGVRAYEEKGKLVSTSKVCTANSTQVANEKEMEEYNKDGEKGSE